MRVFSCLAQDCSLRLRFSTVSLRISALPGLSFHGYINVVHNGNWISGGEMSAEESWLVNSIMLEKLYCDQVKPDAGLERTKIGGVVPGRMWRVHLRWRNGKLLRDIYMYVDLYGCNKFCVFAET